MKTDVRKRTVERVPQRTRRSSAYGSAPAGCGLTAMFFLGRRAGSSTASRRSSSLVAAVSVPARCAWLGILDLGRKRRRQYSGQMRRGVCLVSSIVALVPFSSACAKLHSHSSRTETRGSTSTVEKAPRLDPRRYGGAANYITNPSFETGLTPWQPWGENSRIEITRTARKIGRASARVRAVSAAPYGIVDVSAVSSPASGDDFALSVWVRAAERPKKIVVLLQGSRPQSQALVVARSSRLVTPASWRQIRVSGAVRAAHVTALDAYVLVMNSIGTGDGFLVDGVSLTRA
jgi:Carbohydrate binding domain